MVLEAAAGRRREPDPRRSRVECERRGDVDVDGQGRRREVIDIDAELCRGGVIDDTHAMDRPILEIGCEVRRPTEGVAARAIEAAAPGMHGDVVPVGITGAHTIVERVELDHDAVAETVIPEPAADLARGSRARVLDREGDAVSTL